MKCVYALLAVLCLASGQAFAAEEPLIQPCRLAIPFGSVEGSLVAVGEHLVFVDQDNAGDSFSLMRDQIADIQFDSVSGRLTLQTREPVRRGSSESSNLVFEFRGANRAGELSDWARRASSPMTATAPVQRSATGRTELTYQAKHDHLFGMCQGRFIVTDGAVAFESVDDINHSRQWAHADIKEMKLENPYRLKIKPFMGDEYKIEFIGQGMDTSEYKAIVESVTSARVRR